MRRSYLPILVAIVFLAASRGSAEETAAPTAQPAPSDGTKLIADFRAPLQNTFSTGSWQGKIATTPTGCAVLGNKGADGKGDMGQELKPRLDLTGVKYVEVAFGTGPKNEVPAITIAFNDSDGVQYTASIRIDQVVPGQMVWVRARLADFKLNDWQGDKGGRKINWAKIAQWHVQGDWNTEAPCHIMFIALRTRQ